MVNKIFQALVLLRTGAFLYYIMENSVGTYLYDEKLVGLNFDVCKRGTENFYIALVPREKIKKRYKRKIISGSTSFWDKKTDFMENTEV